MELKIFWQRSFFGKKSVFEQKFFFEKNLSDRSPAAKNRSFEKFWPSHNQNFSPMSRKKWKRFKSDYFWKENIFQMGKVFFRKKCLFLLKLSGFGFFFQKSCSIVILGFFFLVAVSREKIFLILDFIFSKKGTNLFLAEAGSNELTNRGLVAILFWSTIKGPGANRPRKTM